MTIYKITRNNEKQDTGADRLSFLTTRIMAVLALLAITSFRRCHCHNLFVKGTWVNPVTC